VLLRQVFQAAPTQRLCLDRIARLNANHVQVFLRITRIGCKDIEPRWRADISCKRWPGVVTVPPFRTGYTFGYFLISRPVFQNAECKCSMAPRKPQLSALRSFGRKLMSEYASSSFGPGSLQHIGRIDDTPGGRMSAVLVATSVIEVIVRF